MSAQRQHSFDLIARDGVFDVVVIGGGINGLGVFRELSLQGLRVLLVERNDFCSGCSAAPSRMIHGGLRYLENGEFDLVRESLAERDALLRNAPHMVHPLPTTIPIASAFSGLFNAAGSFFGFGGRPARRGAVPIKLGLSLYDFVTRKRRALPRHVFRSARATLRRWPALNPRLICSATYHDAWISHPERLGIELIEDTAREAPQSVAVNYADLMPLDGAFELTDRESGARHPVSARAVVNASGAWLDKVNAQMLPEQKGERSLVSGTKGSHLIIDNPALVAALDGHMMFFENTDGRVCIVFPYLGKALAGSTDIRVDSVGRTRCEDDERDYILGSLGLIFPDIAISERQIVFSYSGIRPLPASDHDFTGRISRGHSIHRIDGAVPQFCMVGGKWTTFRAFAEQTTDAVLLHLGQPRLRATRTMAIGGGADYPQAPGVFVGALRDDYGLAEARAADLAARYGSRAGRVLNFCRTRPDDRPLAADCLLTCAEIAWLVRHEHVVHLSDIVLRRTALAVSGEVSRVLIDRIAAIMTDELGWSAETAATERQALSDELESFHGVSPAMLEQRSNSRSKQCA